MLLDMPSCGRRGLLWDRRSCKSRECKKLRRIPPRRVGRASDIFVRMFLEECKLFFKGLLEYRGRGYFFKLVSCRLHPIDKPADAALH